jgi:tetratricopeptide (TPR) repeat protein
MKTSRRVSFLRMALVLAALFLPLSPEFTQGMYVMQDLVNVPVERLIRNLEAIAEKEPKNAQVRFNLARVHAMAYALKTDTARVVKNKENQGAWFGYAPDHVPFKAISTSDKNKLNVAREHLTKAIEQYEEGLKLDPANLTAALGHAWCVEQSGDKERAIKEYREVIETAWVKEKDLTSAPLGWRSVTAEAAGYLIPLLDKNKDSAEINVLQARIKRTNSIPRPITPIVVPLRDGLTASDLEDRSARVAFDADGTGLKRSWTWITNDAGWLVYDPHGTGKVGSALQMFGSVTFWMFWENGYQALAALDNDRNGILKGGELQGLAIWQDIDGDGVSDRGEVKRLVDWGIVGLSCRYVRDGKHPDGIAFSPRGIYFRDGSSRATYDVILRRH